MSAIFESVVEQFQARAQAQPDAEALVLDDNCLTYGELDSQSSQFAMQLRQRGIGSEDRVGLLASRNLDTVIAIIGILKAGAAYVPIDPLSGARRRLQICRDAALACLLVEEKGTEPALESVAACPV